MFEPDSRPKRRPPTTFETLKLKWVEVFRNPFWWPAVAAWVILFIWLYHE